MNILLSYPRSGSTWLRYMISNTSNIMCLGDDLKENIQETQSKLNINGSKGKKYDLSKPSSDFEENVLLKCHDLEMLESTFKPVDQQGISWVYEELFAANPNKDILDILHERYAKLIFLYRDPFEVCCRGKSYFYGINEYANIFNQYANYKGDKIILSYSDLIKNPKEVLDSVLLFLDYDYKESSKHKFDKFFKYIEQHKKGCVKIYQDGYGYKSYTKGESNTEKFHQSHLKDKHKKDAYKLLKKALDPLMFDLYFIDQTLQEPEEIENPSLATTAEQEMMQRAEKESRLRHAAKKLHIPKNLIYEPPKRQDIELNKEPPKEVKIQEKPKKVGFIRKCFGVLFGRRGSNKT
tara:strand:+ start:1047 stop:2099 length:1053 start_codon:yes stop_codon:yes gene_type:complete